MTLAKGHGFVDQWLAHGLAFDDIPENALTTLRRFNYRHAKEVDFIAAMGATRRAANVEDRWAYFCACVNRILEDRASP